MATVAEYDSAEGIAEDGRWDDSRSKAVLLLCNIILMFKIGQ